MKPLTVRYERFMPKTVMAVPRQVILRQVRVLQLEALKALIDGDQIDEVILCGAPVCTGWRVGVRREVSFVERPTSDAYDETCQKHAAMRILQR